MKKIKYALFSIILFSFPIVNALASSNTDLGEKKIMYIAGIVLMAIRIVVPIVLIVIASFDLIRAMAEKNESEMKKVITGIIPKVISAIIIFLLPTLVALLLRLMHQENVWNGNADCLLRPSHCEVDLWAK